MAQAKRGAANQPAFLANPTDGDIVAAFLLDNADRVEKEAADAGMSMLVAASLRAVRRAANEIRDAHGLDEPVARGSSVEDAMRPREWGEG